MLSGKKVVERAKKIIKEHPEYFEALLEFERTGKLPKLKYKERANFTIDSDILRRFRICCEKNRINMSAKIEAFIEDFLKK